MEWRPFILLDMRRNEILKLKSNIIKLCKKENNDVSNLKGWRQQVASIIVSGGTASKH